MECQLEAILIDIARCSLSCQTTQANAKNKLNGITFVVKARESFMDSLISRRSTCFKNSSKNSFSRLEHNSGSTDKQSKH